jgi:vitamin B12 transporter
MSIRLSPFVLVAAALPLVAQEQLRDTARVSPIIVSATRLPMALGALPVAVTVIRGEDLRLRGIATVADALNDVTSAYVAQSGSQGGTTSLFLRGGESKYVKVLIDGVPANAPGGVYDFASLTTDNVDRIEVVRGPVSVIYGADAVTGVVQIITRRGAGPQRVETDVRVGTAARSRGAGAATQQSVRTWDATTSLSGALSSSSYSVAVARHYSGGLYQLNNRYLNNVLSGRFVFSPLEGTDVRLSLRYNDYQFNYPTNGAGDVSDSNAYRAEDRTVIGVEVERQLTSRARTVLTLNSSVNDGGTDDGLNASGNSFVSQDKSRRRGAEWRLHWLPGAHAAITIGAQLEQQDQRSQSQSQSPFGPFYSVFRAARRNTAAYAEALLTPSDRLTATIGARIDENEKFGQFATGRAGVSWRPLAATRLRATAGTAFREPSFFENYATGFVTGNPALEPEQTRSADVGVDQEVLGGRAQLALTGFMQRFRDMIDYTGANACGFSYCNVAAAESNGLEVELRGRLAGPVSAAVGGTLLHTRVATPGYDATPGGLYRRGESLIRRPGQKWTAELTYRGSGPLSAAVRVLAVGDRPDRDFHFPATPVTLPAYQRVDIGGQYVLRARSATRTSVTLRVENLLDEEYQNIFNFLAPRRTTSIGVLTSF